MELVDRPVIHLFRQLLFRRNISSRGTDLQHEMGSEFRPLLSFIENSFLASTAPWPLTMRKKLEDQDPAAFVSERCACERESRRDMHADGRWISRKRIMGKIWNVEIHTDFKTKHQQGWYWYQRVVCEAWRMKWHALNLPIRLIHQIVFKSHHLYHPLFISTPPRKIIRCSRPPARTL